MLKNKILLIVFIALCAVLSGTRIILAQTFTDNSRPKIVKAIGIEGNKSIGIAQILARIKTRVGEEYQDAVVSDDLKRLYNTGHFSDVQIDHEILDDGYKVIVRLKEKPIVGEITFSKIRYYNTRFLLSKMKTKKDKFFCVFTTNNGSISLDETNSNFEAIEWVTKLNRRYKTTQVKAAQEALKSLTVLIEF